MISVCGSGGASLPHLLAEAGKRGPAEDAQDFFLCEFWAHGIMVSRPRGFHYTAHHPPPSPLFIISSPINTFLD